MAIRDAWAWAWRSEREREVWSAVGFVIRDREVYWLTDDGSSITGHPYPAGTREHKLWDLLMHPERDWSFSEDAMAVQISDGPHLGQTVVSRRGESILFLSDALYEGVTHTYLVNDNVGTAHYLGKRHL